ncbi:MAG: sigma-54 dependent transcriptional regulator [Acidobacteriota bacterium]
MRVVLDTVEKVLTHDVNVMILGESGVGKNYLAESIHLCGNRQTAPFVSVDCASIPPDIFESELFGYEKGAFTGATARKQGRIEMAQRGTLYLDEVASVSPELQAKLLRVVQEKQFSRLGGNQVLRLESRLLSSSNVLLDEAMELGRFRRDLYYRLNVVSVLLPPLRDRREDIPLLAQEYLGDESSRVNRNVHAIDPAAMKALREYSWPGNLRQLRNVIERAVVLAEGETITTDALAPEAWPGPRELIERAGAEAWTLDQLERRYVEEVLRQTRNRFSKAAAILGINRKTLLEKRKKYGLD